MVAEAQDNFFQDSFRDTLAIAFFEILRVASVEEVSLYEDVPLGLYYDELDRKYRYIFQEAQFLSWDTFCTLVARSSSFSSLYFALLLSFFILRAYFLSGLARPSSSSTYLFLISAIAWSPIGYKL